MLDGEIEESVARDITLAHAKDKRNALIQWDRGAAVKEFSKEQS